MAEREQIIACQLGMSAYNPTWELQRMLQTRLIEAKRADPRRKIPHVILLVEHPHVYTLGKSGDRAHLLATEEDLSRDGASFVQIDRGGDITYHGPGQLVVYPILDLDYFYHDIHRYLRDLEEAVIQTCAEYGIKGTRIEGRTGVWIDAAANQATYAAHTPAPEPTSVPVAAAPIPVQAQVQVPRKICAMGVRCSRWVTMHGIGFNVSTDLKRYEQIIPCGITDGDVTSIEREAGTPVTVLDTSSRLLSNMGEIFNADISIKSGTDADTFLKTYLAPETPPTL